MNRSQEVLLDTQILAWASLEPGRLSPKAREICESPEYQLLVSPASSWEMVTKARNSKWAIDDAANVAIRWAESLNARWVPIDSRHILHMAYLPWLHKDPFDRILMGQALSLGVPLLTSDRIIHKYARSSIKLGPKGLRLQLLR